MNRTTPTIRSEKGFALLTAMFLIVVLGSMLSTYMVLSRSELQLAKASRDSASGFNAAEAGLNLRAEDIRAIFQDYGTPEGVSPADISDCDSGTTGSGDFACETYAFSNKHSAVTFVREEPNNPLRISIPPGEPFAGLTAQEFRYTVSAVGRNNQQSNEAILDLTFKSRVVPMFQFAIFFSEDLEFFNGAAMEVGGAVHTNGDMYLAPQDGGQTRLEGQVTVAGDLYRGQKSQSACTGYTGLAQVKNPTSYVSLPNCSGSRVKVTNVSNWNENLVLDVPEMSIPSPEEMAPLTGAYWLRADLRLQLVLTSGGAPDTSASTTGVRVVDADGNNIAAATNALHNSGNCPGLVRTGSSGPLLAVGTQGPGTSGNQLRLYREYQHSSSTNNTQRTLEVDMRALLNCIHRNPIIIDNRGLNDETEGGLVFHLSISGPNSNASHNNYSVRVRNAAALQSNLSGAATVKGMTVVSDQGLVVWGNYNSSGWIPAALMGDTIWLLSNSWSDSSDTYQTNAYDRDGNATTVQAAVVTGIKRTGDANGTAGQDHGADSNGGGVINFMRFNEWFRCGSGCIPDFTYVGSIVSLGPPSHSQSSWGPFTYYSAPNRNWSYDTRFNDPEKLPPMTPVFVYNKQELFVRDYEL